METFDSKDVLVKTNHAKTIAIIFPGFPINRVLFVIVGITVVTIDNKGEFLHIVAIVEIQPVKIVRHGTAVQVEIGVLEAGNEGMFATPTLSDKPVENFHVMLVTVAIEPILLRAG
jgi:hypothetical protein